jgi:DNA replication protein DnaC
MSTQIMARMRQLKLPGMAEALQTQHEQIGAYEGLPFIDRLALLVEHEALTREHRKHDRLVRQARFKLRAHVQDIDYEQPRNFNKAQIARLAQGEWIERAQNLLITGPCGSGKTYLGCAIGHSACLHGYSVRYLRLSRLFLALTQAKADGSYVNQLRTLSRTRVLIIDDWGLESLKPIHRNDLMEIMDDRHEHASTVMISQLPTDQWYSSIGDNTFADAILDRLMHNAHRLQLKGESMRKLRGTLTEDEHLEYKAGVNAR